MRQKLSDVQRAHRATRDQVERLTTQNRMLQIIAGSADVALAIHELASRIALLVPCDRLGLALLLEDGRHLLTYSARVSTPERRKRPRPEVIFTAERTAIGDAVRSQEPVIVHDIPEAPADPGNPGSDASAAFRSALVLPLVTTGRAVGTLNVVARSPRAFNHTHIAPLKPVAELLAVAWLAQQYQTTTGRYRTMEIMSDLTLSIASEINGALQTIVGYCGLLERSGLDPALRRDLATIVSQAHRIAAMLEGMRLATDDRLREATPSVHHETPLI